MAWIESHQTLRDHPKLTLLSQELGIHKAQAIGHLQMLWWWCINYAENGDISRYSAAQIASASGWEGIANDLVAAMIHSGFIDSEPLRVHDWLDFCGDLIKKRLEYKKAKSRRTKRLGKSLRKPENSQLTVTIPDRNQTLPNQPNQITPAPKLEFEKIWEKYPKRLGRKEAEKHFKASVKTESDFKAIDRALGNYKQYIHDKKIEEQFIKMGSTWFNNWRDWIEYTGGKYGTNGGTGISEYAAIARRAREAMGIREPIPIPRALSPGIRNLSEVQIKAETSDGGGLRGDVEALEILRNGGFKIKPAGP